MTRAAMRHMYERGSGSVIITSSPHALATVPDAAAYAASKGGVHALMRALALEAAPHAASFITGSALSVDGGLMAALPSGPALAYTS